MKRQILPVVIAACVGLISGCGKSSDATATATTPDPVTQPEAQAALFQRTCDRVNSLIAAKDFAQAQKTLDVLKGYKLTAEQQQLVDKLQTQIPKAN